MNNYDRVLEATADTYQASILENPIFYVLANGLMTKQHYIAYLKETYHLVRHTSKALAMVGAHLPDERRALRGWFFHQSVDEHNHDLFCVEDLKAIDEDPDIILDGQMMAGAWGMVTQNYYMACYGNPAAILGVATATEGLGADLASKFADLIEQKYDYPREATSFLRSHGISDQGHIEEAMNALNNLVEDERELEEIIFARRMTLKFYGQMFEDVLSVDQVQLPETYTALAA